MFDLTVDNYLLFCFYINVSNVHTKSTSSYLLCLLGFVEDDPIYPWSVISVVKFINNNKFVN